jgi:type II secretory pathway predicted ATPase ExeA
MYNGYFGFLESPFSVTPDPRFFYTNPVYLEAYANLRYGIEAKKGFIAITGEVGTGKTTLLRKLMRSLDSSIHTVFIFNTEVSFNELLRLILLDLGLPAQGKDRLAMIDELNAYLIEQVKQGDIVCLLIDEVQNLRNESLEGLRLLSNLETDREKLLQIVLMGQPEFKAKLDQPNLRQLKQRIALQCEIAPLKDEEVASYIDFRLRAVGYEGQDLFDRESLQQIAFHSKGIPRLINVICDNALLIAFAASRKTVSANVISEVARDLRLGSEAENTEVKSTFHVSASKAEKEPLVRDSTHPVLQYNRRRMGRVGVGTFFAILALVLVASFSDPKSFFTSLRTSEVSKDNLNQSILPLDGAKIIAQKANAEAQNPELTNAEVESKRKDRRVIIQYGSTIYEIASEAYGTEVVLGMDLIKEFNPDIKNLNWVFAGQGLLVPALTRQTLLRPQPDGSYRLVVASFLSRTEADESARRIGKEGHPVIITPRRVANDLMLHRLEIEGLKNLKEANQTVEAGRRNGWLTFAGEPGEGSQVTQADKIY